MSEWHETSIGDIADIVGGGTPSTKNPANYSGLIPWLTPKDLSGPHPRYVKRGKRNISEEGLQSSSARLLPTNSVLLSSRAPIGYVALAANPIATNQGFKSLIVKPPNHPEFIYYWLIANIDELERYASGSTFKEISGTSLGNIRLRIPACSKEQRAIAHILGTLDDKIELNRKQNETLEAMARALFKAWFIDFEPVRAKMEGRWQRGQSLPGLPAHLYDLFPDRLVDSELGEIPEGWRFEPFATLIDFKEGPGIRNWQYTNTDEGIRFINIRCIQEGDLRLDTANRITEEEANGKYTHFHLKPWDIVVSTSGTLGRSAIIRPEHLPLILNTSVIRFRPVQGKTSFSFLYQYLNGDKFLENLEAMATGSVQKNFGPMHLNQMDLLLPPFDVMRTYEATCRPIYEQILGYRSQANSLAQLRDTLLPKLVSGKLCIRNANKSTEALL